jgi:hypothetical protein
MAGDEPPANSPSDNNPPESDDKDHGENDADMTEYEPRIYSGRWMSFLWARDRLREHEVAQRDLRNRLPDLIRRHIELLEAGDDRALDYWRRNEGKEVMMGARDDAHRLGTKLQGIMEDFLYYQNQAHRWGRARALKEMKRKKNRRVRKVPKKVADKERKVTEGKGFRLGGENAPTEVKAMLNAFDKAGTGGAAHRTGMVNANGVPSVGAVAGGTRRPIPPHELRLWTPLHRRPPQGLRNEPFISGSYDLVLDLEAIAERQRRVDSKPNTTEGVQHRNHLERRREELEMYDSNGEPGSTLDRPSTCRLYPRKNANGEVTIDSFRHIRTNEGLFISARESSRDWRTSYDYLGWAKSGQRTQFEDSTVREMPTIDRPLPADEEDDDEEDKGKRVVILLEDTEDIAKEITDGDELETEEPPVNEGEVSVPGEPLEKIKTVGEVDYPYQASEFTRIRKKPRMCLDPAKKQSFFQTTKWAEETTGRREWHVHMDLSPSSSVDSPPHSPIDPDAIDVNSIPAHYPDSEIAPLEPSPRRKCTRDPERCRAWWTHAPDECWIVESVPARARPDQTQIPAPETFRLPTGGRKIYDARLLDHYGIDGADGALWPKIGIRVPYQPMTFDDHKLGSASDGEVATRVTSPPEHGTDEDTRYFTAIDSKRRRAHEVHSLAVPIIKQSQEDWGVVDAKPPLAPGGGSNGGGDDESPDEGDIFMSAYLEGSAAGPGESEDDGDGSGEN